MVPVYSAIYVAKKMTKQVATTSFVTVVINLVVDLVFGGGLCVGAELGGATEERATTRYRKSCFDLDSRKRIVDKD